MDGNGKAKVISIDGRSSNVVKLPNGVELCEASLSIFLHDYPNIMEAQFHQQSIDKINLLIVRGCNYSEIDENRIKKRLPELFNGAEVFIKYVDEIPRTSAGKFKIVKVIFNFQFYETDNTRLEKWRYYSGRSTSTAG